MLLMVLPSIRLSYFLNRLFIHFGYSFVEWQRFSPRAAGKDQPVFLVKIRSDNQLLVINTGESFPQMFNPGWILVDRHAAIET